MKGSISPLYIMSMAAVGGATQLYVMGPRVLTDMPGTWRAEDFGAIQGAGLEPESVSSENHKVRPGFPSR